MPGALGSSPEYEYNIEEKSPLVEKFKWNDLSERRVEREEQKLSMHESRES